MIGAILLTVAIVVFLVLFDWNWFRGPVGRFASAQLNREVVITGDLRVHPWSFSPKVEALGVRVAQPDWAAKADPKGSPAGTPMAKVDRIAVQIKLLPLLKGDVILPLLAVDRPDVRLLREGSGRANWTFGDPKAPKKPLKLPAIQHFIIKDGQLRYEDQQRDVFFLGTVSSNEEVTGDGRGKFVLEGKGQLNRSPFTALVTGGPLLNISPNRPYPFDAKVDAGSTHVLAKGQVTKPFNLGLFETQLTVSGADLNRLYALTGLALPNTPPYRISGHLTRNGQRFDFNKLSGRVGDSDVSGDLFVLMGRERPYLEADLQSKRLDFDDMGSLVGAAPATGRGETASAGQKVEAAQRDATQRLLPDATLQVERVKAMDAKVKYRALAVNAPGLPLKKVRADLTLEKGVLTLDPIAFTFSRGDLTGKIRLDANPKTPRTDLDLRLTNAKLEDFIPIQSGGKPAIEGGVMARAKLTGYGNSVHRAASSASGQVTLVSPKGQIRQAFAELLGVNASKGLLLLLSKDNRETSVRCAVADFSVKDGIMTSNHIVADTGVVLARGKGTIDLRTERMDLRINGDSKKPRLVRLFIPITVKGPFMAPKVGLETGGAVAQGGVAAALGLFVTPLAAVLPFVTGGEAKDADCAGLVAEARSDGAPVKVAQTTPAKAKKK
ncbi:membrane assembly protein AsmA [Caulobacter sp. Root487D2Y]|uniref:AsmA family protein n=1 Tax=Caulobacter sp. Root487D2Y TaxID=1736547 RepID=UPI0006F48F80|nr:AsmA family protein [Caulobacter sp. Root487D2Y]KQY35374.1 membrane assembly protein AsmA [Caulobacter sp. Root487D2Y]